MKSPAITLPEEQTAALCRRWKVKELALFGSVLREDFNAASDLDVMVTFASDARWSLLDHVQMQEELARIAGRPVDLLTRPAVERSSNPIRRRAILDGAQVVYGIG